MIRWSLAALLAVQGALSQCLENNPFGQYYPPSGQTCMYQWGANGQMICNRQCANPDFDPNGPWCYTSLTTAVYCRCCQPTKRPTNRPTTKYPTRRPTKRPTRRPTTKYPTKRPTKRPTTQPTKQPTQQPTAKPTPYQDPSFQRCAGEGETCHCTGTVVFGANGSFNSQKVAGSISCTVPYFGDPISVSGKECFCKPSTKSPTNQPTVLPTNGPSASPTTNSPPNSPTTAPTTLPTSQSPTPKRTQSPSSSPTIATLPSSAPTTYSVPTNTAAPTSKPDISSATPTTVPTPSPTSAPTVACSQQKTCEACIGLKQANSKPRCLWETKIMSCGDFAMGGDLCFANNDCRAYCLASEPPTSTSAAPTVLASSKTAAEENNGASSPSNSGAIAGGVAGGTVCVALAVALVMWWKRSSSNFKESERKLSEHEMTDMEAGRRNRLPNLTVSTSSGITPSSSKNSISETAGVSNDETSILFSIYKRLSTADTPAAKRRSSIGWSGSSSTIVFVENTITGLHNCIKVGRDHVHLQQEFDTLKYLKQFYGWRSFVVEALDFVGPDEKGDSGIVMPAGQSNLREYVTKNKDKMEPTKKLELSIRVLAICRFFHDCGLVWGDIKPENFVLFMQDDDLVLKGIDMDSAKILRNDKMWVSGQDQVTQCYVSPERWKAHLEKQQLEATKEQDVFAAGLVLFFIWTGRDFFDQHANWEELLFNPDELRIELPQNLAAGYHRDVQKILKGMLEKMPEDRPSLNSILSQRSLLVNSIPSEARDSRGVSPDLGNIEEKLDRLTQDQGKVLSKLTRMEQTLAKTFQLVVNDAVQIRPDEVPNFVLMLPYDEVAGKPTKITQKFGKTWRTLLKKADLKLHFKLVVLDETEKLLADYGIEAPSLDNIETKEPMHEGYDVTMPGRNLRRMAPFLNVMSQAIAVGAFVAKIGGITIPPVIKTEVQALKDLGEAMGDFSEIWEGDLWQDSNFGMGETMDAIKEKMDAIQGDVEAHEDLEQLQKNQNFKVVFGPFYQQLKELLCPENQSSGFRSDLESGKIVKLVDVTRSTTHFVSKANFLLHFASRKDKFAADRKFSS